MSRKTPWGSPKRGVEEPRDGSKVMPSGEGFEPYAPEAEEGFRIAPPEPTADDLRLAIAEYKAGLGIALKSGYKIKSPVALRRVGLWLRHLSGDDVTAEIQADEAIPELGAVGICSVCGEHQYPTPSGDCCKNGHGGALSRGKP